MLPGKGTPFASPRLKPGRTVGPYLVKLCGRQAIFVLEAMNKITCESFMAFRATEAGRLLFWEKVTNVVNKSIQADEPNDKQN